MVVNIKAYITRRVVHAIRTCHTVARKAHFAAAFFGYDLQGRKDLAYLEQSRQTVPVLSFESRLTRLDFGHFGARVRIRRRFIWFQATYALASTWSRELFNRNQLNVERFAELAKVQTRRTHQETIRRSIGTQQIQPSLCRKAAPRNHI